jgi:hypothetical protein
MLINTITEHISKRIDSGELSNEDLVQLIEHLGGYLNLQTIPNYAKANGKSYNVKNFRTVKELFGVKFIVDNE